ncbi:MAG: hypothetical protein HKN13_08095, partial [Rhodothermales bacterium]|nr:hypothetical protein [Rhodothermales bacterium]
MRVILLAAVFAVTTVSASAQNAIYVGPQIGTQGIGASAEVDLGLISASGELAFLPVSSVAFEADDVEFEVDVKPISGLLMVNIGPEGSKFSFGAGLHFGGFNADGQSKNLRGLVDIGDGTYPSSGIGDLEVDFEYGGVAPAVMLGLRGGGFNIGLGVAFTGSPAFTMGAT